MCNLFIKQITNDTKREHKRVFKLRNYFALSEGKQTGGELNKTI